MKILLYTITDCQFSKQEKEYLQSHNLPFEEKNLETNREFLTEMLAVSNNFAGTPVTKIEKDDGQIVVLKGFTKEDFDKTLGFATAAKDKPAEVKPTEEKPAPTPETTAPPVTPVVPQETPVQQTAPEPSAPKAADPMANILDNLAQQAQTPSVPAAATPSPLPPQNGMPTIPDPQL